MLYSPFFTILMDYVANKIGHLVFGNENAGLCTPYASLVQCLYLSTQYFVLFIRGCRSFRGLDEAYCWYGLMNLALPSN